MGVVASTGVVSSLYTFVSQLDCAHVNDVSRPHVSQGITDLKVHTLSSAQLPDRAFGFPGTFYYGRLLHLASLYPSLMSRSGSLSDSALDAELAKRLQKRGHTVMFRLNDVLKDRFAFFAFQNLLKSSGSAAMIVIPPASRILPGAPSGCTECPTLELDLPDKLPACDHDPSTLHQSTLNAFDKFLLGCVSKAPVAVVEESEAALDLLRRSAPGYSVFGTTIRYNVPANGHKKVSTFKSFNIMGVLKGASSPLSNADPSGASGESLRASDEADGDGRSKSFKGQVRPSKRKIVLCAHFDTFSLLQSYRSSATNNTGLIAVLEIVRLLDAVRQQDYEVVVLLTSGAVLNFQGASTFANSYGEIDNVELVLCLDDLTGRDLYVHEASKATPFSQSFQQHLSSRVSKTLQRGVHARAKILYFQHEQFTRQKVHAVTVTSVRQLTPFPLRQRSFEYRCERAVFARHIVSIAQALSNALQGSPVPASESEVESRIAYWEEKLSRPRCALTSDLFQDEGVRSVVKYLRPLLREVETQKVQRKTYDYTLYASAPLNVTFYTSRSSLYHLLVLVFASLYIFGLWSVIRGSPKVAYRDILQMFSDTQSRRPYDSVGYRPSMRPLSKYKIV